MKLKKVYSSEYIPHILKYEENRKISERQREKIVCDPHNLVLHPVNKFWIKSCKLTLALSLSCTISYKNVKG